MQEFVPSKTPTELSLKKQKLKLLIKPSLFWYRAVGENGLKIKLDGAQENSNTALLVQNTFKLGPAVEAGQRSK